MYLGQKKRDAFASGITNADLITHDEKLTELSHPMSVNVNIISPASTSKQEPRRGSILQTIYRKFSGKDAPKTSESDKRSNLLSDDNANDEVTIKKNYQQLSKQYNYQQSQLKCANVLLESTRNELGALKQQINALREQLNNLKEEKEWYENSYLKRNEELEEKKILVSVLEDEKEQLMKRNEDLNKRVNLQISSSSNQHL